jgi:hypothetical protein
MATRMRNVKLGIGSVCSNKGRMLVRATRMRNVKLGITQSETTATNASFLLANTNDGSTRQEHYCSFFSIVLRNKYYNFFKCQIAAMRRRFDHRRAGSNWRVAPAMGTFPSSTDHLEPPSRPRGTLLHQRAPLERVPEHV